MLLSRLPWLTLALLALFVGLWAGLMRSGWALPLLKGLPMTTHGPLMVAGFLGTLISLERVVALRRSWGYMAPILASAGTLLWAVGFSGGSIVALGGSAVLIALYLVAARQQFSWPMAVMGVGGLCWGIGNLLWATGAAFSQVIPWWGAFVVLTIAGERWELARLQKFSGVLRALFVLSLAALTVGLVLTMASLDLGVRVLSGGMLALALWLLRYDIARRTLYQRGLVRFIAVCLLSGYCWFGVAGMLGMLWGGVTAGPYYDAIWHALFVGFVFSMIFGHALIIFPALLRVHIPFSASFYIPLALLHFSLMLRVISDLALWFPGRQWGGLFNVLAILFFFANAARTTISHHYARLQ